VYVYHVTTQQYTKLNNHELLKTHETAMGAGVLATKQQRRNVHTNLTVGHFDGTDPELPIASVHRDDEAELKIEEMST
jgi:hypothetical protein